MKRILLQGILAAAALLLLLLFPSAGRQAIAQTAEDVDGQLQRADQFVPILVHEDLFILELGVGIDLEMRCGDQDVEAAGGSVTGAGSEQPAEDTNAEEQLGCEANGLRVKAEQLLQQLGIKSDLAARIKELMERALREEIVGRVREQIEERLRERRQGG